VTEPSWLTRARTFVGLREIPGKGTTPAISRWLRDLRAWWSDDETPWCGVFVAAMMRPDGHELPKHWYRARAWLEFGEPIAFPVIGAVVVFNGGPKRPGAGHVGFVVGRDEKGRLMVLGGNQSNAVTIAPFDTNRVLGYRFPKQIASAPFANLPMLASNGAKPSDNEA
jgi:uncharacterized protein (TIGR02594 family)